MGSVGSSLFGLQLTVANVGPSLFAEALLAQKVCTIQVDWHPPALGDPELLALLERLAPMRERIDEANRMAFEIFCSGQPVWVAMSPAIEVIPGFKRNLILHAGPARRFDDMVPAQQGGLIGAAQFEGLARSPEEAAAMIRSGEIEIAPGLDYGVPGGAVAPTSASMPVHVCRDAVHDTEGYTVIQEGPFAEALRWGVYTETVKERLTWFRDLLAPALDAAVRTAGGINLRNIVSRAMFMGDENHSRQVASTLLILNELMPHLVRVGLRPAELAQCVDFLSKCERFFLHALMAGAASVTRAVRGVPYSTVMWAMGGNGVEFGIKLAGTGDRWFVAPAPVAEGRYLNPSWTVEDTVPYLGDSCAVEVWGLGGFAAAASPAVTLLTGGTVEDATRRTLEMREVTVGLNPNFQIPALSFEGTPTAVDALKVLETGIEPLSHVGITHKKGGQAGAGVARIPMNCFKSAVEAFASQYAG